MLALYLLSAMAAAVVLPAIALASEVVTFDWVPMSETPATGWTTTPSGTLQLTLSSFALTTAGNPPGNGNYGPYYASGTDATTADITAFSYTAADGLSVNLSNVTLESVRSTTTPWQTSGLDTPAPGNGDPFPSPTLAYYLVSGFSLSGKTAQGSPFMMANNVGTAGATYANGVPNGDATFNATASGAAATEDGGYWKVVSVTPVPLPPGLALLLSGVGLLAWFVRRNSSFQV